MALTWNEFRSKHRGHNLSKAELSRLYWSQNVDKLMDRKPNCRSKS